MNIEQRGFSYKLNLSKNAIYESGAEAKLMFAHTNFKHKFLRAFLVQYEIFL